MKKRILTIMIFSAVCLFLTGCVSSPDKAPDKKKIWPSMLEDDSTFYMPPANLYSREKADAVIKNMLPQIKTLINGDQVAQADSVVVDGESVKISWKWNETVSDTTYSTVEGGGYSYGYNSGLIFNKNTDNVRSDTYRKVEKGGFTIIQFEDLAAMYSKKASIWFSMKGGDTYMVIIDNDYNRKKWMDAVYSATRSRNYDTRVSWGMTYQTVDLTDDQKADSTVDSGVVITFVQKGSPVDAASLQYLDIIQSVDGKEVNTVNDFQRCVKNLKRDKVYSVEAVRWKRNGENVKKRKVKVNIVL